MADYRQLSTLVPRGTWQAVQVAASSRGVSVEVWLRGAIWNALRGKGQLDESSEEGERPGGSTAGSAEGDSGRGAADGVGVEAAGQGSEGSEEVGG